MLGNNQFHENAESIRQEWLIAISGSRKIVVFQAESFHPVQMTRKVKLGRNEGKKENSPPRHSFIHIYTLTYRYILRTSFRIKSPSVLVLQQIKMALNFITSIYKFYFLTCRKLEITVYSVA